MQSSPTTPDSLSYRPAGLRTPGALGCRPRQLIVSAFLACSLLAGCGGTHSVLEPEEMPRELVESSILRTPTPLLRDGRDSILIKAIDGKPATFLESKWIVEPGWHTLTLEVELHHESTFDPKKSYLTKTSRLLELHVEAGREYVVDAREDSNGLWIWVYDAHTRTVVAGESPAEVSGVDVSGS